MGKKWNALAWDVLKIGLAKAENPKSQGYYWQVLARACKGFNVQRGETFHTYSALYN